MSYAVCCNAECDWAGPATECQMLGKIGPLCPKCDEVVEPEPCPECAGTVRVIGEWVDELATEHEAPDV